MPEFRDRADAGRRLASMLTTELPADRDRAGLQVLALPRGGVPVAGPIAAELGAGLSLLLVRKIGVPDHPELAMGAMAAIGDRVRLVRNEPVIAAHGVGESAWDRTVDAEHAELDRRMTVFGDWLPPDVGGKPVILVDDGLATGQTMRAAIQAVGQAGPLRIIVAAGVAAAQTVQELAELDVEVVCGSQPRTMYAVGEAFRDFHQITDDEMLTLLEQQCGDRTGRG